MVGFSYAQRWQQWVAELDYRHVLTVATLLILPLFLRPQGIDLTDLGYAASNAQQFFDHPENMGGPGQLYWLGNLLTAVCLQFFKFLGFPLLGLKIGYALCLYPVLYLTYRLLRNFNGSRETVGGIVLCLLFATGSTKSWLNYNTITSLLLVGSAYSLYVGLFRKSLSGLVVSGLVAGLARLPNFFSITFILAVIYSGVISGRNPRDIVVHAALFVGGYFLSILGTGGLMIGLGHAEAYIDSLNWALSQGSGRAIYGARGLTHRFIQDHFLVFIYTINAALGVVCLSGFIDRIQNALGRRILIFFASGVCMLLLLKANSILWRLGVNIEARHVWQYVIPGALSGTLLLFMANAFDSKPEERVLACLALLVLQVAPLGSGNGMKASINGVWIALPFITAKILSQRSSAGPIVTVGSHRFHTAGLLRTAAAIVVTTLVMLSSYRLWSGTYRDSSNRLTMRYSIDHPMTRGVLTTEERATVLQELLDRLRSAESTEFLLALDMPLLCYLTEKQPYLFNSWPGLQTPAQLRRSFEKAGAERPELPVFVGAKGDVEYRNWPEIQESLAPGHEETTLIVNEFLSAHSYTMEFENAFFEIWTTHDVPRQMK